jgi:hypothetical protein
VAKKLSTLMQDGNFFTAGKLEIFVHSNQECVFLHSWQIGNFYTVAYQYNDFGGTKKSR